MWWMWWIEKGWGSTPMLCVSSSAGDGPWHSLVYMSTCERDGMQQHAEHEFCVLQNPASWLANAFANLYRTHCL
eukprot:1160936-Pelagomonas_calceolata.AAC.7